MKEIWWQRGVQVFFRLSVWIAAPVLVGIFLGKWLDQKFNSEPILFLITVGLSFILSMFGLIRETLKEFKALDKQQPANSQTEDKNND